MPEPNCLILLAKGPVPHQDQRLTPLGKQDESRLGAAHYPKGIEPLADTVLDLPPKLPDENLVHLVSPLLVGAPLHTKNNVG